MLTGPFERFVDFINWPISQRAFMLGVLGLAATSLGALINLIVHLGTDQTMWDLAMINRFMAAWLGLQLLATLVNLPAARAGREGRAGAYVFIVLQGVGVVWLLHLIGTMATPLAAIFPTLVILWVLYFDERIGMVGLALMLVMLIAVGALEAHGLLPYAPAVQDRVLDAQRSGIWFGAALTYLLLLMGICISLALLFLRSLRRNARRLRLAHEQLGEANRLIRRYVPAQLADQILSGDYSADSKPRRRRLTIVFTDVVGFTEACEALPGDVVETALNTYLSEMAAIVDRWGGTLNQIVGDGIMIFFGAPQVTNDHDHALRAVRMALEMQRQVVQMQALWSEQGWHRPFRIRIGINTGEAMVGDFGSSGRKLYSGIGLNTNLAERIQSHCEPGTVLLNHSTMELVHRDLRCEPLGELRVKGASAPLLVYRAVDPDMHPPPGETAAAALPLPT